jgi:hypothetical protein
VRQGLTILMLLMTAGFFTGCAGLQKEHYFVCPYDTVWQAAEESLKDRPVVRKDKVSGLIETAWTEMPAKPRGFGMFNREAFDNKERARLSVELKPLDNVTKVSVVENRERWHVRGGVTQQAVKWSPVEPSEETMTSVLGRITANATQRGCGTP